MSVGKYLHGRSYARRRVAHTYGCDWAPSKEGDLRCGEVDVLDRMVTRIGHLRQTGH